MKSKLSITGLAALLLAAAPAAAQDDTRVVSAADLPGVADALRSAGYDIEITERDDETRAAIEVSSGSDFASVLFDDCNEAVPDLCDTLVLSTWWDRTVPISDEAVAAANINHKYVSVFRDGDGDPVMQWAILTRREGIPTTVFLNALVRFISVARNFDAAAFEGDAPAEEASEDLTGAGPEGNAA